MLIVSGFNNYSPERIAQARKEMVRFQRLEQYGRNKNSGLALGITLEHLEQFGRNSDKKVFLLSSQFCFRELPIRKIM